MDGYSAEKIFNTHTGYSYDDIIILPGYIDFNVNDVSLKSHITKNIEINSPIISSPMDTVTESSMAIAMALQGGLGIIHCNNEIEEQGFRSRKSKKISKWFYTKSCYIGTRGFNIRSI